ncbi:MAG: MucR family transcriptional regulator, partial [Geodermatophilaceae bacterium]|nr:MucR family transcriptional regulator [Geodermatophilaceae bacterium]
MAQPARTPDRERGAPADVRVHPSGDHPVGAVDGHRGTHAHLWALPDGTGLHAPYGRLVRDPDSDRVCCHLCGRWFRSLGSHVRRHGLSAADYRQVMGLCRSRPLTAGDVSAAISRRQAEAYRAHPDLRERLAAGQQLARSGQLAWRARSALDVEPPAEHSAVRSDTLRRGRETRDRQREAAL